MIAHEQTGCLFPQGKNPPLPIFSPSGRQSGETEAREETKRPMRTTISSPVLHRRIIGSVEPRRNANRQRASRHIRQHDRIGAHGAPPSQRYRAQYYCARTD